MAKATNPISFEIKYPAHVLNITALHDAQFSEYGSPSTMFTMVGRNPTPPYGKKDILKTMGIRVKRCIRALLSIFDFDTKFCQDPTEIGKVSIIGGFR